MIKCDWYYYKDETDTKLSLDWFKYEDHWSQRYMFDRPMWEPDMMERIRVRNLARCKWFRISLNLFSFKVYIDIKLKHIGNVYQGRLLKDEPHVPEFVKRNREKKAKEQK